jgi:hypothetical protein
MNAIPKGDRINNEQWTFFKAGVSSWVEVGDTIGTVGLAHGFGVHYVTSPVYFWAYFPDPEYPYTGAEEWDFGKWPRSWKLV